MPSALAPTLFDAVEEALKDVMDPELGVNVVDLGLIYDLSWDDDNNALIISMTLTSAGCPLTDRGFPDPGLTCRHPEVVWPATRKLIPISRHSATIPGNRWAGKCMAPCPLIVIYVVKLPTNRLVARNNFN